MGHTKQQLKKGFTIIEVMIVLAIAGLIMLIVLIAIPQLQRNQRNTARKNIVGRIKTEIDSYTGNNNGNIPASAADLTSLTKRYLSGVNLKDPSSGSNMSLTYTTGAGSASPGSIPTGAALPAIGGINYQTSSTCNGESVVTGGTARQYAMWTQLEGGAIQCLDNQ
jgi:prepilin-type N-terminal cleavage/methylation domain-containing protein